MVTNDAIEFSFPTQESVVGPTGVGIGSRSGRLAHIRGGRSLYSNRSVDLAKEKRYPESFRLAVVALGLDPGFEGARGSALASLEKWAGGTAEGGEPERVRAIVRDNVGLLKEPAAEAKVLAVAYDARGRKLRTAKDWPALAGYYATALGWHRDDK